jgi:hypothetical protein
LTQRSVSSLRVGIKLRNAWYCSSFCFSSAVERELSGLLASTSEQANPVSRMPLGLSLIKSGLVTRVQLQEVVDRQKEAGGEIGELLVQFGGVSERQVTAVRATQWGCPVFSVPKHAIRPKIRIPTALIELHSAIPLHYVEATKLLLVGFVDGIEYGLLYAIEQITGCKTKPCFVTPSDFQNWVRQLELTEKQAGDATPCEMKFEEVKSSAEIAQILCSYGVEQEAEEAVIEKCKEYVWARLICGPKEVDLLFKAR